MSIYKITMWILLILYIIYLFDTSKLKEELFSNLNREYEGSGSYPNFLFTDRSCTVDKIKINIEDFERRKLRLEQEMNSYMKGYNLKYSDSVLREDVDYEKLFNEYKEVIKKLNNLKTYNPDNRDYYNEGKIIKTLNRAREIEKLLNAYNPKEHNYNELLTEYEKLLKEIKENKLTNAGLKALLDIPSENKLQLVKEESYKEILYNRINSINTDIDIGLTNTEKEIKLNSNFERELEKEIKKNDELNNATYNKELKNLINEGKNDYVYKNIIFNNLEYNEFENLYRYGFENKKEEPMFQKIKDEDIKKDDIDRIYILQNYITNKINNMSPLNIPNNNNKFYTVNKKINYILKNVKKGREYFYNCELVIYRNTNHAKHIEIDVLFIDNSVSITDIKVLGIITEDKLFLHNGNNEHINNLLYFKYDDKYVIEQNERERLLSQMLNMTELEKFWLLVDRLNKLENDRGLVNIGDYLNLIEYSIINTLEKTVKNVGDAIGITSKVEKVNCIKNCAGSFVRTY